MTVDEDRLDILIWKQLDGEISDVERTELLVWLATDGRAEQRLFERAALDNLMRSVMGGVEVSC